MEYVDGPQLIDKICEAPDKVIGEKASSEIMYKLFSAISHCHAYGIIHRDIKPENVMFTKSGELKLIDFGLSTVKKTKITNEIAGTGFYIAPEML